MQITLRTGITLRPGTFSAVIAPERLVLSALNGNPELGRFLFLFICGNYSRLISHITNTSKNFNVRRPFTADQMLTVLRDGGHTIVFIEHDATLFDGADRLLEPVGAALKDAGHEALVVLWAPSMDRSFAALARHADRIIEIVNNGTAGHDRAVGKMMSRNSPMHSNGQTTLEVN